METGPAGGHDAPSARGAEKAVDRLTAFSDGVFAIAITLLVLQFEVPRFDGEPTARQLGEALAAQRTNFFSYVLSFAVLGTFWAGHHRMFGRVQRIDSGVLWINLLFLFFCALLPYPTNLLGDYAPNVVAVVTYALTLAATALAAAALWWYLARRGLLTPDTPPALIRVTGLRLLVVAGVFLVSVPVAFIDGNVAMFVWFTIWIVNHVVRVRGTPDAGAL